VLVKSEQRRPYLAFDFGAESGRAVLAYLQSGILTTEEVHRFRNEPVEYGGSLHWDVPRLWFEVRKALACVEHRELAAIGVDAWGLGLPAESKFSTGIEVAVEAERLATDLIQKYPRGLFVAGQLIFDEDTFATRILHNESAFMIQRRLQHAGVPMVVLPVRLNLNQGPRLAAPSLTEERAAS
jgi:hypothetical protein